MKRILPLALFILSGILHSQTISFLRNFDENLLSVISKDDNKYLATDKYSIFQLDENGFVEWESDLFSDNEALSAKPVKVNNDDYIVGVGTAGKISFIRYSSSGEELLRMEYTGNGFVDLVHSDNGFLFSLESMGGQIFLRKVDYNCSTVWYLNLEEEISEIRSPAIALLSDAAFVISADDKLIKVDEDGNKLLTTDVNFSVKQVIALENEFVIGGVGNIAKYDNDLNLVDQKGITGLLWINKTTDGGFIALKSSSILKLDENFNVIWEKEISKNINSFQNPYLAEAGDGGYFFIAQYSYLIKTDNNGEYSSLTLNMRVNNQTFFAFNSYYVQWTAFNVNQIDISYSADAGGTWIELASGVDADLGIYEITLPNIVSDQFYLKISDSSNPNVFDRTDPIGKVIIYQEYDYIAANEVRMWIGNNGDGSHDPNTDGSGFYWPGGENAELPSVFEDGLLYGGKINGEIRVNGSMYRHGLSPGIISADGTPDEPMKPEYKIFKLKKGWENLPEGIERDRYEYDYNNWPGDLGAPYIDVNGDGEFTQGVDTPEYLGDETLFTIANGMDADLSEYLLGSPPAPVEIRTTVWAYNSDGMEDVVFKKFVVTNKGNDPITDMYLTYWTDPDLGFAGDDYVGCDTLLSLGYCYNGDENDENFYESPPPAVGHLIVQGPIVEGSESDSAFTGEEWITGFKNLPLTGFQLYIGGSYVYRDPVQGDYEGTIQVYNNMQGLDGEGNALVDPNTGKATQTVLAGNPVEGNGWYTGEGWPGGPPPCDMREIMSSGTFELGAGESQEFAIAIFMAQGTDRLNSVTKLKEKAIEIHEFYSGRIVSDVREDEENQPLAFDLRQNYPNPFNPTTTIVYQLPKASKVSLKIYNILGKEVAELVNAEQNPGTYKVSFNGNDLASGVYFYRLIADDFIAGEKMILLK